MFDSDLKNPDYQVISNPFYVEVIQKFLAQPICSRIGEAVIYQEYEFVYQEEDVVYHGVIDLMLEYADSIDIIDYKLKNTNDSNYNKQLEGYRNYISNKSGKRVNTYLYSLIEGMVYEIN